MAKKTVKKVFITIGSILVLGFLITLGISYYVARQLTHPKRKPITKTPDAYDLEYHNIQFPSRVDSLQLKGWFIPADSSTHKIVIEAHGYRDNRSDIPAELPVAKALNKVGLSVLLFDFRAEGESPGKIVTGGLYEVRDLLGAVDYAKSLDYDKIGVLGFSMGATTTIRAAGQDTLISAIVADGAFNSQFFNGQLHTKTHLPTFPFTPEIIWIAKTVYGIDFTKIAAEKTFNNWKPRPALLIAGTADQVVPVDNTRKLYNEIKDEPNTEFWVVKRGRHIRSYNIHPDLYVRKVAGFFSKFLY